MQNKMDLRKNK